MHDAAMELLDGLAIAYSTQNENEAKEIVRKILPFVEEIEKKIQILRNFGRQESSTFKYWDSFLDASQLLFHLIRADRSADFSLHLESVARTIIYFFAAGKHNYARYIPIYIADMKRLEQNHPATHKHIQNGGFVVHHICGHRFNSVPTDEALEQTINKECKSSGGIVGFTRRKGTLIRWIVSRHTTSEYSGHLKAMALSPSTEWIHEELGKTRHSKDEADILKVKSTVEYIFQDPFDLKKVPKVLINIVTGHVASDVVQKDLTDFTERAKNQRDKFINQHLVDHPEGKHFLGHSIKARN